MLLKTSGFKGTTPENKKKILGEKVFIISQLFRVTIEGEGKDESAYGERLGLLYCGALHSLETEAASCKTKQNKISSKQKH